MLPHGGTVAMKEGNVKRVFWQTPPLHVPRDWEHRTRGLTEQMARLSVPELVEREKSHGPEGTLAAIECHRCPWGSQNRCEQAWKGLEGVDRQLAQKREMLDAFRNAYWQEFLRVVEVLERFGAVQDAKLLAKGQLISGLRHDNELLVAEIVDRGILADTTLPEAATLCSGLIEESRSGDAAVARALPQEASQAQAQAPGDGVGRQHRPRGAAPARPADAGLGVHRLHAVGLPLGLRGGRLGRASWRNPSGATRAT